MIFWDTVITAASVREFRSVHVGVAQGVMTDFVMFGMKLPVFGVSNFDYILAARHSGDQVQECVVFSFVL